MRLDLTDTQVSAIREWAAQDPRITEVRVFGSRATGTSRPGSDVDLAVTVAGNACQSPFAVYFYGVDTWQRDLTALLGIAAHVKWIEAPPAIARSCRKASHMIYKRSSNDR